MHVAEAGPADGPAVVLCHGFPECWYSWRHQLQALGDAGYHVLAPDQRGYGTTDRPLAVDEYTQLHLVGDIVGVLDAFGIDTAVVVGHDWGGPVAWHSRAAAARPLRRRRRTERALRRRGTGADAPYRRRPRRCAPRSATRSCTSCYFQEPGVAEARARRRPPPHARAILYGLSGDIPRDQYRFFDPHGDGFFDVVRDLPGPLPWLSDADLDVFVESFRHHGTFAGGINWYRNIDRNQELLRRVRGQAIEQPALFIGAELDSIFGQTPEAVLATRSVVPEPARPGLDRGSGHWIQQEKPDEVNAALLDFLRSLPGWEGRAG